MGAYAHTVYGRLKIMSRKNSKAIIMLAKAIDLTNDSLMRVNENCKILAERLRKIEKEIEEQKTN